MPVNWRVPAPTPADQGNVLTADTAKPNGQAFETGGGGTPSGPAGGDLSGTYPNPTVARINGRALGAVPPTAGSLLLADGTVWKGQAMTGDASISGAGAVSVLGVNGTTVPATPSTNQAIVATGAATATWQAIANSFNTRTGAVVLTAADVQALFTAAGQLFVGTGSGTGTLLANGSAGQVLTANAGAAPSWQAAAGGTSLLKVVYYNPGSLQTYSVTATTLTALDTTNLRATFTAPTSGNVLVRLTADAVGGSGDALGWGLLEGAGTVGAIQRIISGANQQRESAAFYITGISAGSHSYDWAQHSEGGVSASTFAGGAAIGAAVMEVWAA